MSGQKSSKTNKNKLAQTKKGSSIKTNRTKNSYKKTSEKYATEQNKNSGILVALIVSIIVIGSAIFIFNRIRTVKTINDNIEAIVESGTKIEETSRNNATSTTAQSSASKTQTFDVKAYKELLNEYVSFMEEYVAFMKKYQNASSSEMLSMMKDYTDIVNKQLEWADKLEKYNEKLKGEVSEEEYTELMKAYSDTIIRIAEMTQDLY